MSDEPPAEPRVDGGPSGWAAELDGYRGLTIVGRGGTATVYSARRRSDGHAVAVKVFDAPGSTSFERQLRTAERLQDVPGVLPFDDHGELGDGRSYLVSPFAHGGPLGDLMQRFGPTPPGRVAALGSQLARTLGAAHRAGVLHRDLKPSNVLIDVDGSPLLADFGAATLIEPETASETMAVTVIYAAPEVLEGAPATERSDLYSLGLTLLALAVGSHPFGGSDDPGLATLVNRICSTGAPDPSGLGVPDGLAAVLRRATALDPDDRYASGDELALALDRVTGGDPTDTDAAENEPLVAAAAGRFGSDRAGRTLSTSRRRRSALVGAVLALATFGGVVWGALADDEDPPPEVLTSTQTDTTDTTDSTDPTGGEPGGLGPPVTEANGILGPLHALDDFAYGGRLTEECGETDRRVAIAIHADQNDRIAGVGEPWAAVDGENAGTFMAYLPCESGGRDIRYVLRAPGRWFTVVAQFPQDQYDRMVEWMRENETSPAPDYTVDDEIRATLGKPDNYEGWAIIDRAE